MTNKIGQEIIEWAKENSINVNEEGLLNASDDKYEFADSLVRSLNDGGSGYWRDSYEGRSPEGFLPELINGILSTIKEGNITLESVSSNDDWYTGAITLNNGEKNTELTITDAGGDDAEYAPSSLFGALEAYVKDNCTGQLKGIFSDSGYIYLYLTNEQIKEFDHIISKIPEPDYG